MTTFLHTMVRITDPERSRAFYTALGFTPGKESPIVRNGELEATNYFFSLGDHEDVLELTLNHDGRTYDNGTGYGHIAIGVTDLDATLGGAAAAGHRARAPAVHDQRRRLAAVLRPRPRRLPGGDHRARMTGGSGRQARRSHTVGTSLRSREDVTNG